MFVHQKGSVVYLTFPGLDTFSCLVHAVSTKLGGTSEGSYEGLNISLGVGDAPENVLRNRSLLCAALGLDVRAIVAGRQVHGTRIEVIDSRHASNVLASAGTVFPATDALVTNVAGISLLITVADCPALLFFDPEHAVLALAHAGWRGSLANIAGKTVKAMNQSFHTNPSELYVGISPSIGPCCYVVGNEVLEQLTNCFPENWSDFVVIQPEGRSNLDLWKLNTCNLIAAQVKPEHIEQARMCSACSPELFYSYRNNKGKTGRFGLIASLRADPRR